MKTHRAVLPGAFLAALASLFPGNEVVGQDPVQKVIDRSRLGKSDAVSVILPVGRIIVFGTTSQNTISYSVQENPSIPLLGRIPQIGKLFTSSLWNDPFFPDTTAARQLPGYVGRYAVTEMSPGGLFFRFSPPDSWKTDSVPAPGYSVMDALGSRGTTGLLLEDTAHYHFRYADPSEPKVELTMPANVGSISHGSNPNRQVELRLFVPRDLKHLDLKILFAGTIAVQDFDGELVITSNKGPVFLGRIGGSALVDANDGNITATVSKTSKDAPISLMSAKGEVALYLSRGSGAHLTIAPKGGTLTGDIKSSGANLAEGRVMEMMLDGPPGDAAARAFIKLSTLAGNIRLGLPTILPRWPKAPVVTAQSPVSPSGAMRYQYKVSLPAASGTAIDTKTSTLSLTTRDNADATIWEMVSDSQVNTREIPDAAAYAQEMQGRGGRGGQVNSLSPPVKYAIYVRDGLPISSGNPSNPASPTPLAPGHETTDLLTKAPGLGLLIANRTLPKQVGEVRWDTLMTHSAGTPNIAIPGAGTATTYVAGSPNTDETTIIRWQRTAANAVEASATRTTEGKSPGLTMSSVFKESFRIVYDVNQVIQSATATLVGTFRVTSSALPSQVITSTSTYTLVRVP